MRASKNSPKKQKHEDQAMTDVYLVADLNENCTGENQLIWCFRSGCPPVIDDARCVRLLLYNVVAAVGYIKDSSVFGVGWRRGSELRWRSHLAILPLCIVSIIPHNASKVELNLIVLLSSLNYLASWSGQVLKLWGPIYFRSRLNQSINRLITVLSMMTLNTSLIK